MTMKVLALAFALGSVVAVSAAETPAPAAAAPAEQTVTTNRTVKVHSGCKPKRTGKRGGGVEIKHNCRTKQIKEIPAK